MARQSRAPGTCHRVYTGAPTSAHGWGCASVSPPPHGSSGPDHRRERPPRFPSQTGRAPDGQHGKRGKCTRCGGPDKAVPPRLNQTEARLPSPWGTTDVKAAPHILPPRHRRGNGARCHPPATPSRPARGDGRPSPRPLPGPARESRDERQARRRDGWRAQRPHPSLRPRVRSPVEPRDTSGAFVGMYLPPPTTTPPRASPVPRSPAPHARPPCDVDAARPGRPRGGGPRPC